MTAFILRRAATSLVLLWLVVSATFVLIHIAPGDPIDMLATDRKVTVEYREALAASLGLDRPLPVQYVSWLAAFVRLDWGHSFANGQPVLARIAGVLPATFFLAFLVVAVRYSVGIGLGAWAAIRQDGPTDHAIRLTTLTLFAFPTFYLGYLAIELFSVRLGWVPTGGMRSDTVPDGRFEAVLDLVRHAALPALVVGISSCGRIVRLVRGGLLDVLEQDYIRAARARGLGPRRVLWGHAMPNALAPVIQHLGVSLPQLLSGMLIVEVIFAWPGLGLLTFEAYSARDYPVILATTTVSAILVVLGSLAADLTHAAVDPRVRHAVSG